MQHHSFFKNLTPFIQLDITQFYWIDWAIGALFFCIAMPVKFHNCLPELRQLYHDEDFLL